MREREGERTVHHPWWSELRVQGRKHLFAAVLGAMVQLPEFYCMQDYG